MRQGEGKELSLSTPVTEPWMSLALPTPKDRPSLYQQFDVIIMWVLAVSPSKDISGIDLKANSSLLLKHLLNHEIIPGMRDYQPEKEMTAQFISCITIQFGGN